MARRTGKRILWDWDTLADYDGTDLIGICLTQRQVMILKSALIPAYWSKRWAGFPDTDVALDQLDAMISQIDNQLDGNDCPVCNMDFRDNPDDLCEVQYSIDGGVTWITMFRKDVCAPAVAPSNMTISNYYDDRDNITTNYTTWNNDIINVAPDWAYEDEYSDRALCWAIDFYVDMICDVGINQIKTNNVNARKANDWLDDVAAVLAGAIIANMAAAAASGGITIPVLIVSAVTYASVTIVDEIWDYLVSVDYSVLEDMDARQEVKCEMWHYLRGETPQWVDWTASLNGYAPADPNAEVIGAVVNNWNAEVNVYINFLMAMEEINDVKGSLPECDCPVTYLINQCYGRVGERFGFALTAATSEAFSNPGDSPAICPGYLNTTTEIITGVPSSIGGVGQNVRVTLPANTIAINIQVLWRARRPVGSSEGDKNAGIWVGDPNGAGVYVGGNSWGTAPEIWQQIITEVDNPLGLTPTPHSHVYLHNSMDREFGEVEIRWIYIELIDYVP